MPGEKAFCVGKCPSPHPLLDASGVTATSPCRLVGSGRCEGQVREATQSRDPRAACQPRKPREMPARPAACGPAPPDTRRMDGFHSEKEEERERERASERQREEFGKTERRTKRQMQRRAPGEKDPRFLISAPVGAGQRGWGQDTSSAPPSAPTGSASLRAHPRSPDSQELGLLPSAARVWPWPTNELWFACVAGLSFPGQTRQADGAAGLRRDGLRACGLAWGIINGRTACGCVQPWSTWTPGSPCLALLSSPLGPSLDLLHLPAAWFLPLSTPHGMWPRMCLLADPSGPSGPSLRRMEAFFHGRNLQCLCCP